MPEVGWKRHAGDLANTLKAFVGTNYLSLAYGFSLAGLAVKSIRFLFRYKTDCFFFNFSVCHF